MLTTVARKAIEETGEAIKKEDPRRFYGLHLIALVHEINSIHDVIKDLVFTLEETNANLRSLRVKVANGINLTAVPDGS